MSPQDKTLPVLNCRFENAAVHKLVTSTILHPACHGHGLEQQRNLEEADRNLVCLSLDLSGNSEKSRAEVLRSKRTRVKPLFAWSLSYRLGCMS